MNETYEDIVNRLFAACTEQWKQRKEQPETAAHDFQVAIDAVSLFVDEVRKAAHPQVANATETPAVPSEGASSAEGTSAAQA